MSKVDAQRAMREAKYLARQKAGAAGPGATSGGAPTSRPAPAPAAKSARTKPKPAAAAPEGALCGHQSMNNRACTRPAGHTEKSHRYT